MAALAELIAAKVIVLVIIVIVIVSCAIPVIQDAQDQQYSTGQNADASYTAKTGTNVSLTITVDENTVTVGDYTVDKSNYEVFLLSGSFFVHLFNTAVVVTDFSQDMNRLAFTTLTIENGAYSFESGLNTYTGTLTETTLYAADKGDYGLFLTTHVPDVRFNDDSVIYGVVMNTTGSGNLPNASYYFSGTIEDLDVSMYSWNADTHVFSELSDVVMVDTYTEADEGYLTGLVINSVTGTVDDVSHSITVSLRAFFAPIEYKYISDTDSIYLSLIGIIPLLLIICAVMFAVRMINGSRN